MWVKRTPAFADARRVVPGAPYIDWNKAEITEPGTTMRVPVAGASAEWCSAFKAQVETRRHRSFQDPWGQIGLIGVVIFVPAITPGAEKLLRETLEEMVATAQRRVAAAPPQQTPEEMLKMFRSLAG